MRTHTATTTRNRRSRVLTAIAVLALLGAVPAAAVEAAPGASAPATRTSANGAPAQPAASSEVVIKPANRPNPDQVPLVAHSGPGSAARLIVSAPASVAVGQTITIVIRAAGVKNLAGYEGVLRFDSAAAQFDGLSQRTVALAGLGRDVEPLGPVEVPSGVAFGLYSCSLAGCGATSSRVAHAGATGTVALAKLTLVPTAAGRLSLALGSMRFVDASGKLMTIALPGVISVQVGTGGPTYPAPGAPALTPALTPGIAPAVSSADVSGDGIVGPADLNTAAIEWGQAREAGQACGVLNDPADVNHDGCLDVQDLQLIAARVAPRPAGLAPAVGLTFTVNSTLDTIDKNPGNGLCLTATNVCTLRAAIAEANLDPGQNLINFAIPGAGVHTIVLTSGLPVINDINGGVTIDGYSQPGAAPNSDPLIDNAVIDVQLTTSTANIDGLIFSSSSNVVRGLALYNLRHAITFQTKNATLNSVVGNFIGTNAAGTFVAPAFVSGGDGVTVTQGASFTTVGDATPAGRNVISGNSSGGISFDGEQSDHNTIQGNLIGPGPTGQPIRTCTSRCFDQQSRGVHFKTGSSYNLVGGTGPGQGNVVSDNAGNGIEISHGSTTDSNQAIGNFIGTDVTGNAGPGSKFGNGLDGVQVEDGSTNTVVAFNVVANNAQHADGSLVIGGIEVLGFYTAGTWVHDNKVGVGADGVTPMPNNFYGIDIHYNSAWTTVGPNNVVANNPTGIIVSDASNVYNTITRNSVYNNGSTGSGRGISILNHANNSIAVPNLNPTGVSLTAATGAACPGCTVEVFQAQSNVGDASAGLAGQGKTFLGSTLVPASGAFTVGFNTTLTAGNLVTATQTTPVGDTSQFSPNIAAASNPNPTPPPTPAPTPAPSVTTYASDTFSRSLSTTWGRADIGGNYAGFYCTNPDMNVTGSVGTVLVPDPHSLGICAKNNTVNTGYRGGFLTDVSAQDVDVRFKVATDTLATSDNINVAFDARRVSGFTSYRGQVRLVPGNQVWLQADTLINNVIAPLGTSAHAVGVTVAASSFIWVRAQLIGTNPTTINMKAWNDGQPEPATWAYTFNDSTPVLQAPGAVGLVGWLSGNWSQGPITLSYDDLNVTSPISGLVPDAPVADFSFTPTSGTLDENFTDTSTGGTPTSWFWDFGDGASSASQSPVHTYAAAGTYTVKLITTNDGGSSSKTETVVVAPIQPGVPAASFTWTQTPGTLDVVFADTSTNAPTSWAWDFGDGATSAGENPTHTYGSFGPYQVTLKATNVNGTGTTTQAVQVNPLPLPGATYLTVTPNRLVDSRKGIGLGPALTANVATSFQVTGRVPLDPTQDVPAAAVAVTGNLTVTGQTAPGFVALTTTPQNVPLTSTLNFPLGDTRANGVTAPLTGTGGKLWITYGAKAGAHIQVIFDVTGYFVPDASGSTYKVVTPSRLVDTRPGQLGNGLPKYRLTANAPETFFVVNQRIGDIARNIPAEAIAVTGNLTVTNQTAPGFFALTTLATAAPITSTLNFPVHDTRANGVTIPLGPDGSLSVTYGAKAGARADVIFDVTGYFLPELTGASYVIVTPTRLVDSRYARELTTPLAANVARTFNVSGVPPLSIPSNAVAITGNLTVTGQTAAGYFSLGPVPMNVPTTSTMNFPLGDTRANGVTVPLLAGSPDTLSITYAAISGHIAQAILDVTGYFVP